MPFKWSALFCRSNPVWMHYAKTFCNKHVSKLTFQFRNSSLITQCAFWVTDGVNEIGTGAEANACACRTFKVGPDSSVIAWCFSHQLVQKVRGGHGLHLTAGRRHLSAKHKPENGQRKKSRTEQRRKRNRKVNGWHSPFLKNSLSSIVWQKI